MDVNSALEIHFKNLGFATPFSKEDIDELRRRFYELYDIDVFDIDESWYMRELSPVEFLNQLSMDAMNNIVRRDSAEPLPDDIATRQIEKIEYTSKYRDIARLCLNMTDLSRYGISE